MEEYRKINSEHYISFRLCSFSVQFFIFCETVWVLFIYAHTHIPVHMLPLSFLLPILPFSEISF